MASENVQDLDSVLDDAGFEPEEKPETPANDPAIDEWKQRVERAEAEAKRARDNESKMRSAKDKAIQRLSKAAGVVEASGAGRFDPETGDFIVHKSGTIKDDTPDYDSQIRDLEKQIAKTKGDLKKQYSRGDLTDAEYMDALDEEVDPLKDQLINLKLDKRDHDKTRVKKTESEPQKKNESDKEYADRFEREQMADIQEDYPDIANKKSDLWQKMEIEFEKNRSKYNRFIDSDGNLKSTGWRKLIKAVETFSPEKPAGPDKFASPKNQGHRTGEKSSINSEQAGYLKRLGITDRNLLRDIGRYAGSWESTGKVIMED